VAAVAGDEALRRIAAMTSPNAPIGSPPSGLPVAPVNQPTRSELPHKPDRAKPKRTVQWRKWLLLPVIVAAGVGGYFWWKALQPAKLPEGFASSNGRIEATEVDIATKLAGRLRELLVNEGDFVTKGQILAQMDTDVLTAQLREAEADFRRANKAVETAQSAVLQRDSEKSAAEATVAQREAEHDRARKRLARSTAARLTFSVSEDDVDNDRAALHSADAAVKASKASVAAAVAAISTTKSQVIEAEAAVVAANARIQRIQADIDDSTLKAPRDGRVQYRIAQVGEVLPGGGKVLNMVDLTDVYMTFFLPEADAGRVKLNAETHLVLDALPQFVLPAKVTFVADVAQFTPKTVETAAERQKLTFRVKAHIPEDLLKKYIRDVKTGLPGVAYVQLDPQKEWPANMRVKLPE
jgi:HlyD family secretion protein